MSPKSNRAFALHLVVINYAAAVGHRPTCDAHAILSAARVYYALLEQRNLWHQFVLCHSIVYTVHLMSRTFRAMYTENGKDGTQRWQCLCGKTSMTLVQSKREFVAVLMQTFVQFFCDSKERLFCICLCCRLF